jgi:diadenosine tetraphosphate (Ap4A) HIT family hydrolase
MTIDEYIDAFSLVRRVKTILQNCFKPQGFNVGVNCGEAAGQSVFHAHIHLIPRYTGDVPHPRGGVRNVVPGRLVEQGRSRSRGQFPKVELSPLVSRAHLNQRNGSQGLTSSGPLR